MERERDVRQKWEKQSKGIGIIPGIWHRGLIVTHRRCCCRSSPWYGRRSTVIILVKLYSSFQIVKVLFPRRMDGLWIFTILIVHLFRIQTRRSSQETFRVLCACRQSSPCHPANDRARSTKSTGTNQHSQPRRCCHVDGARLLSSSNLRSEYDDRLVRNLLESMLFSLCRAMWLIGSAWDGVESYSTQ